MNAFRRILVTNDDGIDAPGLTVAAEIAAELSNEVWIAAPERDQSGVSQGVSLHTPLRIRYHREHCFSVSGTPADCVLVALAEWFGDRPPDLVISGVNCGANLSDSLLYSGTVGAVLTATHLGIRSIALSQAFHVRDKIDFTPARCLAGSVIRATRALESQCLNGRAVSWNINFPASALAEIRGPRITRQVGGSIKGPRLIEGFDGRGLPYRWLAFERDTASVTDPQSDVAALRDGFISVTPLAASRCDDRAVDNLLSVGCFNNLKGTPVILPV